MRNKSVAVLDIRSSEICAAVGERGVNNTFIIKSKYSCAYDGFAEGVLLDEESFDSAVYEAVKNTLSAYGERIKTFYIGVPDEFIKVVNTDKVLSFASPKKITGAHVESLVNLSRPKDTDDYTAIKRSALYYVLPDKRRVIDPVGAVANSLRGVFGFYLCKKSFVHSLLNAFKKFGGIKNLNLIPQCYAQAMYLISPERRDGYAVLFDMGYISSSYTVVCGNGVAFSEAFSVGVGHVAALLMNELDIPFEAADYFVKKINLNAKERLMIIEEYKCGGKVYSFSNSVLRDLVREGLDGICETLEECRNSFTGKNLSGKTLFVTGEGIKTIRGAAEHLSSRLVSAVDVIAPNVPYYDKPQFSSLFSLLWAALGERSRI